MYTRSFNECMLIGKCGVDPEVRYTSKNVPVTNLTVGTVDVWKDKNTDEFKNETKWHKVVVWGKLAERVSKFVKKGMFILVKGPISYRKYTNAEGQEITITEIKAIRVQKISDPQTYGESHAS